MEALKLRNSQLGESAREIGLRLRQSHARAPGGPEVGSRSLWFKVLGVESFSILLNHRSFLKLGVFLKFWRFARIPGKNGEGTPNKVAILLMGCFGEGFWRVLWVDSGLLGMLLGLIF